MKILFINYYMKQGGISTSLLNLLEKIKDDENNDISLLLLNDNIDDKYQIPDQINLLTVSKSLKIYSRSLKEIMRSGNIFEKLYGIILHIGSKLIGERNFVRLLIRLQKKIGPYDVAISFTNDIIRNKRILLKRKFSGGCNDYVLMNVTANKKFAWVHNEPNELGFNYKYCKKMYKKFDAIVHVAKETKNKFDELIPEYKLKSVVVNNIIDEKKLLYLSKEFNPFSEDNMVKIVTVARIDNNQKRIDRIIECCSRLKSEKIVNFSWTIIGDGPDLNNLKKEAESKKS
jgi:glycosyltransferase involved in cell wall biosynthesis